MKKILLVEFNNFHEEVLLSQLSYLYKSKWEYFLYINASLNDKVNLEKLIDKENIQIINSKNKFTRILSLINITQYIQKNDINVVIFNSYENIYVQLLSKFIINKKKIAIVHNLNIFQKDEKKFNNFFVLNNTLYKFAKNNFTQNFDFFYPLVKNTTKTQNINNNNTINIVIPGLIELSRRDYLGLLEIIKNKKLDNIKFIFLGNILKNDGLQVLEKIKEYNLLKQIKIYKDFIPYKEYFDVLNTSDIIMPLIHPNVNNFEKYHKTKITAAFTMAFSFKKPLFLYKSFLNLEEFRNFSISYDLKNLIDKLENLNHNEISNIQKKMEVNKIISFNYQREKYLELIE